MVVPEAVVEVSCDSKVPSPWTAITQSKVKKTADLIPSVLAILFIPSKSSSHFFCFLQLFFSSTFFSSTSFPSTFFFFNLFFLQLRQLVKIFSKSVSVCACSV